MSSFISHAIIGGTLGKSQQLSRVQMLTLIGFCWMPDIDYVFRWLFDYNPEIRWTHSIITCLCVWGGFILFAQNLRIFRGKTFALLSLLAVLSHLGMDWFVGGPYGDPLFWPLTDQIFSAPLGILPAAGKLDLANYYFWRNLVIELGIVLPLLAGLLLTQKKQWSLVKGMMIFIIFIPFLIWGISLTR